MSKPLTEDVLGNFLQKYDEYLDGKISYDELAGISINFESPSSLAISLDKLLQETGRRGWHEGWNAAWRSADSYWKPEFS